MVALALLLSALLTAQTDIRDIERLAREGWLVARAAATTGGSAEALRPVGRALLLLDKASEESPWRLQGEYARALIAAAIAAAQDERAELELHLTHARDLAERLHTSAHPAEWPLPIDEAAGELWFEVDQYAEALTSYERALASRPRATAYLGAARSAARLGNVARGCAFFRQWLGATEPTGQGAAVKEAQEYLTKCP